MQVEETSNTTMRRDRNFCSKIFLYLYFTHLFLVAVLMIFLIVRGLVSAHRRHFHPREFYLPFLASIASAGVVSFGWQAFTYHNPSRTLKVAFWLGPLLTCAIGVLLVSISTAASLAIGIVAIISAVIQSLYSCWVIHRVSHATRVLTASIAYPCPKSTSFVLVAVTYCILYSCFLMSAIGGATATRTRLDIIFIFIILLSFIWTMHIIRNTLQVVVSHIKYMQFASGIERDPKITFFETVKHSMGCICLASFLIPVLTTIRGLARAITLVSGDVDEFMFSCTSCYSVIASRVIAYANRWGLVHVGVYNKGIVQASADVWEMFRRVGMEQLLNSDLTSSFCFLCGTAAGALSALVGGSWALAVHKSYATEISIYGFLIGYLMSRVTMALPQASLSALYVAYAENPQSQQFDSTIPAYIQHLHRYGTS